MKRKISFFLVGSISLSCQSPESIPDNPCYQCQILETFRGLTSNSYSDQCGTANVTAFIQRNTYQQAITQGNATYILRRTTTCVPK